MGEYFYYFCNLPQINRRWTSLLATVTPVSPRGRPVVNFQQFTPRINQQNLCHNRLPCCIIICRAPHSIIITHPQKSTRSRLRPSNLVSITTPRYAGCVVTLIEEMLTQIWFSCCNSTPRGGPMNWWTSSACVTTTWWTWRKRPTPGWPWPWMTEIYRERKFEGPGAWRWRCPKATTEYLSLEQADRESESECVAPKARILRQRLTALIDWRGGEGCSGE